MTGDEIAGIDALKKHFGTMFDKKDPSPLKYFLGIEVSLPRRVALKQRNYALDLLKEIGNFGARPSDTPL